MLKVYNGPEGGEFITFSEIPDEISLCLNISNCKCNCSHCSEPWLRENVGEDLTEEYLDKLFEKYLYAGISCICLMGGDSDYGDAKRVADYIHSKTNLKTAFYSGREFINIDLIPSFDYYKIGRWIMPEGPVSDWHKTNNGVLQFPWSNQLLFKKVENRLENITYKFRKKPLGNPEQYIIK